MLLLLTVVVYPSAVPPAAVAESAVFAVVNGTVPSGEKTVRCEIVAVKPAGTVTAQLRPAQLSSRVAQSQVSGKAVFEPIRAQPVP